MTKCIYLHLVRHSIIVCSFFHVFSKVCFITTYMLLSYGAFHDALQQFICYCFRACSRPKITDSTVVPPTYNSARPGVWLTVLFWCVLLVIMDGMLPATALRLWRDVTVFAYSWPALNDQLKLLSTVSQWLCEWRRVTVMLAILYLVYVCSNTRHGSSLSVDLFVRCTKVKWQC